MVMMETSCRIEERRKIKMSRVIILLLDSFGIGCAEDAAKFGDAGADTLGHINEWCGKNRKDESGKPNYLFLPNMNMLLFFPAVLFLTLNNRFLGYSYM